MFRYNLYTSDGFQKKLHTAGKLLMSLLSHRHRHDSLFVRQKSKTKRNILFWFSYHIFSFFHPCYYHLATLKLGEFKTEPNKIPRIIVYYIELYLSLGQSFSFIYLSVSWTDNWDGLGSFVFRILHLTAVEQNASSVLIPTTSWMICLVTSGALTQYLLHIS